MTHRLLQQLALGALLAVTACQEVTPFAPDSVSLQTTAISVRAGASGQLVAAVYDGGVPLPSLGTTSVRWTSLNPTIATVSDRGTVNGVTRGVARVQLEVLGTALTTSATVTVTGVSAVSLDPSVALVDVGSTLSLVARVTADSGVVPAALEWTSSDPSVATVNSQGIVTGVRPGQAAIRVTCEGLSTTRTIMVNSQVVAVIEFPQTALNLTVGDTSRLQPVLRDSRGVVVTNRTLTWTSQNTVVASISAQGVVRAIAPGQSIITATIDGARGSVTTNVQSFVPIAVGVRNGLALGITVTAGGVSQGAVTTDGYNTFTVSRTAVLAWQSQRFRFSDGSAVQDDLNGGPLLPDLGASAPVVDITNIVGGIPYILPVISSAIADTISFQIQRPSGTRCLGYQYGSSIFGTPWGYYRLEPSMSLLVYRGTSCQGNALGWGYDVLVGYQPRSGRLLLRVDRSP